MIRSTRTFASALSRNRQAIFVSILVSGCILLLGVFFYVRGRNLMQEQLKTRLRNTAAAAAMQFDGAVIDQMHGRNAMSTPAYHQVVAQLQGIIQRIPSIRFAYIMRRTADANTLEFVSDADSLKSPAELDVNHNGIVDENEKRSLPGDTYDVTNLPAMRDQAFAGAAVDPDVTIDQWGALISGYAPIMRWSDGTTVAILGIDMKADDYYAVSHSIFSPVAFLLFALAACMIGGYLLIFVTRRRVEVLQKLDEERANLVLLTSHQLGTPLTLFRWSLEALQDREPHESLKEAVKKHEQNLSEGIKRMDGIMNSFRDAARVQEGRVQFQLDWVLVHELVEEVATVCKTKYEDRHFQLRFDLDPDLRLKIDRKQISGVLHELVDNAMTYANPGSTVTVRAKKDGKFVRIDVQDEGEGMDEKDVSRIFGKFVRGSNAARHKPDGNGLGLFIAKGIIERAGGEMWMTSRIGQGTVVSFTLPLE